MNIRHSKLVFSAMFAAVAMGTASVAGAAGLSNNERAAQHAIADASETSFPAVAHDARIGTLAQNEDAAQRVIVVDYTAVSRPIAVGGEVVALVVNERAAQRAIVDAPSAHRATTTVAARPVAVR